MGRTGKGGKGRSFAPGDIRCATEVRREGRQQHLVAGCRTCAYGVGDLTDPVCRAGILPALADAPDVDAIVTGTLVERQYGRRPLWLLRATGDLAETMEELALREPVEAYRAAIADRSSQQRLCEKCPYHPARNLTELRRLLLTDPEKYFTAFRRTVEGFAGAKDLPPVCTTCTGDSRRDLEVVLDDTERLLRDAVREGFSVVLAPTKG